MSWRLRIEHSKYDRGANLWGTRTWVTESKPMIMKSDGTLTVSWPDGELHMLPLSGLGGLELHETSGTKTSDVES